MTSTPQDSSGAPRRKSFHFAEEEPDLSDPPVDGDVSGTLFASLPSAQGPSVPLPQETPAAKVSVSVPVPKTVPAAASKGSCTTPSKRKKQHKLPKKPHTPTAPKPVRAPAAASAFVVESLPPPKTPAAAFKATPKKKGKTSAANSKPHSDEPKPSTSKAKSPARQPDPVSVMILEKIESLFSCLRETNAAVAENRQQLKENSEKLSRQDEQPFRGFQPDDASALKAKKLKSASQKANLPVPLNNPVAHDSSLEETEEEWQDEAIEVPADDQGQEENEDEFWEDEEQDEVYEVPLAPQPVLPTPLNPGLRFANPIVDKLPIDKIPDGWNIFKDGMALGEEPGHIVFQDNQVFGPQSVEVDTTTYDIPIWRFRVIKGAKGKEGKGIIPVKEAYRSLQSFLAEGQMSVKEWTDTAFHPPGTSANRALMVALDDSSIMADFLQGIPDWTWKLNRGAKAQWDEAVCPSNVIPYQISCMTAKEFVKTFDHPKFAPKDHHAILNSRRFPSLPTKDIEEEYGARLNFLSCMNASMTAEAVLRQQGHESDISPALSGIVKATLQPLWTAFCLFVTKRIALRERALKGCYTENQLYQKLIEANIMSEGLFDKDAVDEIFSKAEHQAKSVISLLGFRQQYRGQKSGPRGRGTPNRRGGYRGRQQQTPRGGQGYQRGNQYQRGNSNRGYPGTPRRNAYKGRGRGGRSPATPRTTPPAQGQQQQF